MTEYEILSLAHRVCWKYNAEKETYTFDKKTILEFVRLMRLMEQPNGNA